jgi:hypothetical protein
MRNLSLPKLFLTAIIATTLLQSCKDDSYLLTPAPAVDKSFKESFDSSSVALAKGWKFINTSFPRGGQVWQNGGRILSPLFNAYSQQGSYVGFIGTTFESTTAVAGVVSNWLISPSTLMKNGDKIIFYTRSEKVFGGTVLTQSDTTDWGNRLQVRINKFGDDLILGDEEALFNNTGGDNPGNYDISLLDINPFQYEWHKVATGLTIGTNAFLSQLDMRPININTNLQAYPTNWTRFEVTISGLNQPTVSRFAFRYFMTKAGSNGFGTGVGIDNVEFVSALN